MSNIKNANKDNKMKIDKPFESRYKTYNSLNNGKSYSNYKSYDVSKNPKNNDNTTFIYIDNQPCNDKSPDKILPIKLLYYVEIHYGNTPETYKPKLEYIMNLQDITFLLNRYNIFY